MIQRDIEDYDIGTCRFKMVSFADGFGTAQLQTVKVSGDLKLFHAEV